MKKDLMVYIAGPYSAATISEVSRNVSKAVAMAEQIVKISDCIPFIPHLFHWWEDEHPHEYEFWLNLDLRFLAKCDILFRLEGKSKGANAEVEFAEANNIPCAYSIEELNKIVCMIQGYEYGNLYSNKIIDIAEYNDVRDKTYEAYFEQQKKAHRSTALIIWLYTAELMHHYGDKS